MSDQGETLERVQLLGLEGLVKLHLDDLLKDLPCMIRLGWKSVVNIVNYGTFSGFLPQLTFALVLLDP